MTNEPKEIVDLRGKILSMEMEINLLSKDIEKLETEFFYVKKKIELSHENLVFLKEREVVVSISEYKKIKKEHINSFYYLKKVESKIMQLTKELSKKEINYKYELIRFEDLFRLQFRSNILEFPNDRR
jgi:hypothetical protein